MLMIILLILSPLLFWLLRWYLTVQYFESYLKKIPGSRGLPLLGVGLDLTPSTNTISALMKYYDRYKTNFKLYIGPQPYLFLTEPEDLGFLINSSTIVTKSDLYTFVQKWLGTGLLTSAGNKWRKHRKIITPAFHFQILEQFVDTFNEQSDVLSSILKEECKKSSFDIYPFIARCTLDIICDTAMGTSINAQRDQDSEYVNCVNTLLAALVERSMSPILSNDLLYPFSKLYRTEKHALKVVHDYTKKVISIKKKEYLKNKTNEESVDSFGRKKKRAFLDLLLEHAEKDPEFTDENIREEVDTFMFAGHDTTATSITFALHALAKYPDVQRKAYEELQSIFSDDPKRSATYRDYQEMKYLEMVIKESMRLYATVPFVGRALEQDIEWKGVTLPKGLMINVFIYGIQHSTHSYKDPQTFDPERFHIDNIKGSHPFAFLPFSAGPRNCVGQKFAMLEMKLLLSNVLRNFEILPPIPDHQMILKSEAVLKSDNGVYVRLRSR